MKRSHLARIEPREGNAKLGTRQWVVAENAVAAKLLPSKESGAMTQEDFVRDGTVVDVYRRFHVDAKRIDDMWGNLKGLEQTAQIASPAPDLDERGHIQRAAWKGFKEVNVPVGGGVMLYGRLGAPDPKSEIPGSYIVFTHGLFGSLDGIDTENQVEALRRAGHHVLAIEMRGHGETNCEHPEYTVSFGIRESSDFLAVADWLRKTQDAKRVGLVSFSLTGYEALLTAWLDGARTVRRFDNVPLLRELPRTGEGLGEVKGEPAFNAGMFVVSPPPDIVKVADAFDRKWGIWSGPCKAVFQKHLEERMRLVSRAVGNKDDVTTSMWGWAASEFQRCGWQDKYGTFASLKSDLVRFIDLRADGWGEGVRRMENVREPVLILSAANDPLGTAQDVADLFGRVKNPNIGVVMLEGGGHMGFPALSADYYYSMMLGFFDPKTGPGVRAVGELAKAP